MHALLEHSPCGFAVLDTRGRVLFANPFFLSMMGGPRTLEGVNFQDLLTPGGKLFYETQFAPTLFLRGRVTEIAFDLAGRNGTRVPTLVNATLHPDKEGDRQHILLAIFPAEQRRMYEKELLRARKEFEQIAEVVRRSSDAILHLDTESRIQTWNHGAEQMFGFTAEQVIGRQLTDLLTPPSEDRVSLSLSELRRGRESVFEVQSVQSNGRRLDLSVSLTPHMEAPGTMVSFSAIIRDITSRKLAEKALLQNEKLASVGRLASSIAHEINNPLESVTNLLYILRSNVDGDALDLVTAAEDELARVSQITTHTLRFHKQSSARTQVDLQALSSSVLGLYRARFDNSHITVTQEGGPVSPLLCFEGELRQVMVNLVSNAFDAMRTGGRLIIRNRDVSLWPSGAPGVRITVADTGTGMDKETSARLFEPFFSTKEIGGTGLGLWISKDLVQKNGGRIRIRSSNRPGRSGTVVVMFFPHSENASPTA